MPTTISIASGATVGVDAELRAGGVRASITPLKIDVAGFRYDIGGLRGIYVGAVDQSVADDDSNYVYLNESATLQINTTGFPTDVTYLPLARVVCANGEIVAIHEERVLLAASSAAIGTCRICFAVDGGVRGGETSASSNNDVGAIRYDYASNGYNRINTRPPQNWTSGDLVMRLWFTVSSSPSNGTKMRWKIEWLFRTSGEDLGAWDSSDTQYYTFDGNPIADDLIYLDLTIPAAYMNKNDDMLAIKITRESEESDDDCGVYAYLHVQELRYTGYKVAGQAGQ